MSATTLMAHCQLQVVLAANDLPSINDITYEELSDIVHKVRHW